MRTNLFVLKHKVSRIDRKLKIILIFTSEQSKKYDFTETV